MAPDLLLLDDVRRHATERPDARAVVAVRAGGICEELTWRRLDEDVDRVAAALLSLGVAAGEPVALQLPNRLEFLTAALGTLRVGAVCEPLMPIFRARELRFMLGESGARVLIVPARFRGHDHLGMAVGLQSEVGALEHVVVLDTPAGLSLPRGTPGARWEDLIGRASLDSEGRAALEARRPAADRIAQLLFTSGTSGEAKGVLHRHDVLTSAADAHIRHFGLGADDVIYVPSPLAHQTGFLYGMWIALRLGVPQILQESWDAGVGLQTMQAFGVTFVQAATPFLADLVRVARSTGERPERLRTFVATGAAIPRELAREAGETLRAEVGGAWGTTESCLGTAFAPGDRPEKAWSTDGRALDNVRLRVVDDESRPLPPGQEGHFEVQTDCLFQGYLNRPELTAEVLTADGYYRTGDLARLDGDGYLHITGRVKDVINRGGEKVPVVEVEQILYEHPAVRDVAIVAMPDERLGERACAFVVLEPGAGLDLADAQQYLAARQVAKPYWPERLEHAEELPRTPSGKIQKYVLRDRAGRAMQRRAVSS